MPAAVKGEVSKAARRQKGSEQCWKASLIKALLPSLPPRAQLSGPVICDAAALQHLYRDVFFFFFCLEYMWFFGLFYFFNFIFFSHSAHPSPLSAALGCRSIAEPEIKTQRRWPCPHPGQGCVNKGIFFHSTSAKQALKTPRSLEIRVSLMKRRDFCSREHYKN